MRFFNNTSSHQKKKWLTLLQSWKSSIIIKCNYCNSSIILLPTQKKKKNWLILMQSWEYSIILLNAQKRVIDTSAKLIPHSEKVEQNWFSIKRNYCKSSIILHQKKKKKPKKERLILLQSWYHTVKRLNKIDLVSNIIIASLQ